MSKSHEELRREVFNYLEKFGKNIRTKLNNICSKTGQYDVPNELFQKRTSRNNRVLISWKSVLNNHLSYEQLNTFEGGVVVEFKNNDFFDKKNKKYDLFNNLCSRLGSDDNVSSIISIRSEGGSSSSSIPRAAFKKLINNTHVNYKGNTIIIDKNNYMNYSISQTARGQGSGKGNDKWTGFLFISIRGGQQDTIETHRGQELTLFNPACEYASTKVKMDIDFVCSYFMLNSLPIIEKQSQTYIEIINEIEEYLKSSNYHISDYNGNLLDYCLNHPSLKLIKNKLTDPIQIKNIDIKNFNLEGRESDSIDFTHNEAVNIDKYYWDDINKCILSPARPTNIFWSLHLSNMMQQDFSLDEYFIEERKRVNCRSQLLK